MNNKLEYLKSNGIDVDTAFSFLGDEAMFNEILLEFKNNLPSQMTEIKTKFETKDIENYVILVHALKSNCKTLGITSLANIAYNHEMKGKENDIAFINANVTELFNEANKIYSLLNNYFNM